MIFDMGNDHNSEAIDKADNLMLQCKQQILNSEKYNQNIKNQAALLYDEELKMLAIRALAYTVISKEERDEEVSALENRLEDKNTPLEFSTFFVNKVSAALNIEFINNLNSMQSDALTLVIPNASLSSLKKHNLQ